MAIVCPLPPTRSGIADYFAEQIEALSRQFALTLVIADDASAPTIAVPDGVEVVRAGDVDLDGFDQRIYHQGNNPHHLYVYELAMAHPGIVVLHDYTMHHLAGHRYEQYGKETYVDQLAQSHGHLGTRLANRRDEGSFSDDIEPFLFGANRELLDRSLGVVTHSHWVRRRLEFDGVTIPTFVVPMHYVPIIDEGRSTARAELGLPDDEFVMACLGFLTPTKQIETVIEAMGHLGPDLPPHRLYLVGEPHDDEYWNSVVAASPAADQIEQLGYVSLENLDRFVIAADLIFNLRYPLAGETSATLLRALGRGRACVVTGAGPFDDLPDRTVEKVPLAGQVVKAVASTTRRLITQPDQRAALEHAASAYVRDQHSLAATIAGYVNAVETIAEAAPSPPARPAGDPEPKFVDHDRAETIVDRWLATIEGEHREYAEVHRKRFISTFEQIPLAPFDDAVALDVSAVPVTSGGLSDLGYRVIGTVHHDGPRPLRVPPGDHWLASSVSELVKFDAERHPLPLEPESVDLVTVCEMIEHLPADPMHLLIECNRVLRPSGYIVVTTPNIVSAYAVGQSLARRHPGNHFSFNRDGHIDRHHLEYTPDLLMLAVAAAGFDPLRLETDDVWFDRLPEIDKLIADGGFDPEHRGDNMVLLARKVTTVVDRTPPGLYTGDRSTLMFSHQNAPLPGVTRR